MKTVLVTGGTGFVGRAILPELFARNFSIHATSRRDRPPRSEEVTWHPVDIFDRGEVADLLGRIRPTHLLHLAWETMPGRYIGSVHNLTWLQESISLISTFAASGGERALITGTCMEYDIKHGRLQEDLTPLLPATPYGATKHALNLALGSASEALGLSFAWARLFYLYGPHERPERLVPYVITQLQNGTPAEVTSGDQLRDYLYVQDVAGALAAFLDSDVQRSLNIGSGKAVSVRSLIETIGQVVGRPELISWGARAGGVEGLPLVEADTTNLRQHLNWTPKVDLEQGMESTVRWWRERSA